MTTPKYEELKAELELLKAELAVVQEQKSEAEKMAKAMADASQFFGSTAEEQPTGKTIKMKICLNPHATDTKKHKFVDVDVPTYYYNIQLPAAAGLCLYTNGIEYYHGETYEFDQYTLSDIKSRVARCWDHEKSIHGDNENAYRKPVNKTLTMKGVRR
jgi:hypothetical protein